MDELTNVIRDASELRALYREPSTLVQAKKVPRIDDVTARFVAASPFFLLATADAEGNCDVSPRGGPPGFVRVLDEHRFAIPDLSGNNLIDSLTNIVANPHVGMLLIIPGRDDTLRVEGSAVLTTDPSVLSQWDDELRTPKVAIVVQVNTLFIHCAKSFRRGRVWDPASWTELMAPDGCDMIVEQLGLEVEPEVIRAGLDESVTRSLADERRQPE